MSAKPTRYARAAVREKSPAALASQSALPADAIAAAREICERYAGGVVRGGGIPAVAARMGITPGVLYNKLAGAEDSHHKLTVRDMILVWAVTREVGHLQALARTMNCVAFQVPDFTGLSDQALLDILTMVQVQDGRFHETLRASLEDGRIDRAEYRQLRRQAFDWIGAIVEADRRLDGMADG